MKYDINYTEIARLFNVWKGMHRRCYNSESHSFPHYGGRGIYIADSWHDFDTFCHWSLANGSAKGLEIDRIDVNGPYSPDNCRWITKKQNLNNRRDTKYFTVWGETKTISEWVDDPRVFLEYAQIAYRLGSLNWEPERALTAPIDQVRRPDNRTHCKKGHEYTDKNTYTTPSQPKVKKCRLCHTKRENNRYHSLLTKH